MWGAGPGVLPAALSVGAHPPLVELADGGGFAAAGVVGEQAAAALATHPVEEVPATQQHRVTPTNTGSAPPLRSKRKRTAGRGLDAVTGSRWKDESLDRKPTPTHPPLETARTLKVRRPCARRGLRNLPVLRSCRRAPLPFAPFSRRSAAAGEEEVEEAQEEDEEEEEGAGPQL